MTATLVGFDVTPLEEREPTGIGRYVERLLAALVARGDTHRYHLLASRPLHGALPTGVVGPEMLDAVVPHLTVPFSCMGGIKANNIAQVLEKGGRHPAVVTAVTAAENIETAAAELRKLVLDLSPA